MYCQERRGGPGRGKIVARQICALPDYPQQEGATNKSSSLYVLHVRLARRGAEGHSATLRHDSQRVRLLEAMESGLRSGGTSGFWRAQLAAEERAHPSPGDRTYGMAEAESMLGMTNDALRNLQQVLARRQPALMR